MVQTTEKDLFNLLMGVQRTVLSEAVENSPTESRNACPNILVQQLLSQCMLDTACVYRNLNSRDPAKVGIYLHGFREEKNSDENIQSNYNCLFQATAMHKLTSAMFGI